MAERSKAPDSRVILFASTEWAFWSSNEGVGSNPTSDTNFLFAFEVLWILILLNDILLFSRNLRNNYVQKYKLVGTYTL